MTFRNPTPTLYSPTDALITSEHHWKEQELLRFSTQLSVEQEREESAHGESEEAY